MYVGVSAKLSAIVLVLYQLCMILLQHVCTHSDSERAATNGLAACQWHSSVYILLVPCDRLYLQKLCFDLARPLTNDIETLETLRYTFLVMLSQNVAQFDCYRNARCVLCCSKASTWELYNNPACEQSDAESDVGWEAPAEAAAHRRGPHACPSSHTRAAANS